MVVNEIMQKIQLVQGKFSPAEALEILETLISERINFHKIQKLRMWESDHSCNTTYLDKIIAELANDKDMTKNLIDEAVRKGYKVEISGKLEVKFVKQTIDPIKIEISHN